MMHAGGQPVWAAELLEKVDFDQVAKDMEQFKRDDKWLKDNIDELRKRFPNMFVAVYDRKVVGAGDALQDAQKKAKAAGYDPAKCVIQIVLTEDYIWVL